MTKVEVLNKIYKTGVIAVIRLNDNAKIKSVINAIGNGGIKCIEITMTVPNAIEAIKECVSYFSSDYVIGAGTVTDERTAKLVISNGAMFVVSPIMNPKIISICKNHNVVCIPGCYSPTEVYTAWSLGADAIKVFPAENLGPKFFKNLKGPFPDIKLIPTGGVTVDNVEEWIKVGAIAVGIGSELLDKKAIEGGDFKVLTDKARLLIERISYARIKK